MPLLVPEPISTKVIFFRSVRDPQHFQLIYTKKKSQVSVDQHGICKTYPALFTKLTTSQKLCLLR